jgi:hypothetical protein
MRGEWGRRAGTVANSASILLTSLLRQSRWPVAGHSWQRVKVRELAPLCSSRDTALHTSGGATRPGPYRPLPLTSCAAGPIHLRQNQCLANLTWIRSTGTFLVSGRLQAKQGVGSGYAVRCFHYKAEKLKPGSVYEQQEPG